MRRRASEKVRKKVAAGPKEFAAAPDNLGKADTRFPDM